MTVDTIDYWQIVATVCSVSVVAGLVDQVRITLKSKDVSSISVFQWMVFLAASTVFSLYYIHLEQYMMSFVSAFNVFLCSSMVFMFFLYKNKDLKVKP